MPINIETLKEVQMIRVPIYFNFNHTIEVGYVEIPETLKDKFPFYGLAPGFKKDPCSQKTEIVTFGLVPLSSYVEANKKYLNEI